MATQQEPPKEPVKYRSKHADPNYRGEPCDKELANGPLENRGCTDILCCLIFIAYCIGMVVLSSFALKNGHPNLLVDPYDHDGYQCGVGNRANYPYLYFAIPFTGYTSYTVCVSSCPAYYDTSDYPTQLFCYPNSGVKSCVGTSSSDAAFKAAISYYESGSVSLSSDVFIYNTTGFVGRYCVPALSYWNSLSAVGNLTDGGDVMEKWISDIKVSWPIILASLGIAFIVGLFYMIFIRCCSGVFVWCAIVALIGGCGIFGYYLYHHAQFLSSEYSSTSTQSGGASDDDTKTILVVKIFAYIFWGLAGFMVIVVCCLWSRIRLTIGIIKAAADYVRATWTAMLIPVVMMLLLAGLYVYWIFTGIYLYSYGTISQLSGTPFGTVTWNTNTKRLLIYHLFGGLWINAFVIALAQLVLAISVSLWYFNVAYGRAHATVGQGLYRALRYHIGSLAFGSFIVAFIQLIRIIWAYIQKKLKPYENKTGGCLIKCAVCYVTYCLDCFERYIKFLNKNAYIQVALEGKSFIRSAISAFYLILRNGMMFVLVGGLGEVFIGFGKYLIAVLTSAVGYIILTQVSSYSSKLYSALLPAFIMFCLGFGVGAMFMSVYGMAADTILQCYILTKDLMQNHGIDIKPPTALQDFIDNHEEVKKHDSGQAQAPPAK